MMINKIENLYDDLKKLKKTISKESRNQISKVGIRSSAEDLSLQWFQEIKDYVSLLISEILTNQYSEHFDKLLKLSGPNNSKNSYLICLSDLLKSFKEDIIIPIKKEPQKSLLENELDNILSNIPDLEEADYLSEAKKCASMGFNRATIVLGWCAVIHRVQLVIENKIGFVKFNSTSKGLASQTKGRYKKFKGTIPINSMSELQELFDREILWILEGLKLIDSNQHSRLSGCYMLRTHCAHPGEAPLTDYNILAFCSDIKEIIFTNEKFKVEQSALVDVILP